MVTDRGGLQISCLNPKSGGLGFWDKRCQLVGVWGLGFGFGVWGLGLGLGFGFGVWGLGLGFGFGFGVWGLVC